jgi:hypothetical protein
VFGFLTELAHNVRMSLEGALVLRNKLSGRTPRAAPLLMVKIPKSLPADVSDCFNISNKNGRWRPRSMCDVPHSIVRVGLKPSAFAQSAFAIASRSIATVTFSLTIGFLHCVLLDLLNDSLCMLRLEFSVTRQCFRALPFSDLSALPFDIVVFCCSFMNLILRSASRLAATACLSARLANFSGSSAAALNRSSRCYLASDAVLRRPSKRSPIEFFMYISLTLFEV